MRCTLLVLLVWSACASAQAQADASALYASRKAKLSQLLLDPRSPVDSSSLMSVSFFEPNDSFAVATVILPLMDTTEVHFPTSDGKLKSYRPYAKLIFQFGGTLHTLIAFQSEALSRHPLYRDKLFLPFYDDTNGFESYGGGRYLDVDRRAVDDRSLVLDFNYAYNPWCAYSDNFSCPIPPASNRLPFAVRAGEAAFAKTRQLDTEQPSPLKSATRHNAPAEREGL